MSWNSSVLYSGIRAVDPRTGGLGDFRIKLKEERSRNFRKSMEEMRRRHDRWMEESSRKHKLWMEEMCRLLGLPKPEVAQSHRAVTEVQPDGLNVTPSHCKLAFNSLNDVEYKYLGNLCKNVAIDELEGLGVNEKVDLSQSVIEVYELKVFDEMPRSNLGENEILPLFDEMLENSSGGNDETLPVYDDEPMYDVYDDETENCAMQVFDVAIDELKGLGVSERVDLGHSVTEVHELKVFDEIPRSDIGELKMVQPYVENHAPQVFDQLSNKSELNIDQTIEISLVDKDVREYGDENLRVDELERARLWFILNNISSTIILLLKACLEFDGRNSFLGELSELELPPPEPPPHQFVLVHAVSVGKKFLELESWGQDSQQGGSNVMKVQIDTIGDHKLRADHKLLRKKGHFYKLCLFKWA